MSLTARCNGQSVFGNACNIVASAKNLFSPLATMLQTPKTTFFPLQQCCKRQKPLFPRCNNVANAKNHFFLVATILQAPKSTFRPLQHYCKHFQKRFGRRVASLYSYIELTLTLSSHKLYERDRYPFLLNTATMGRWSLKPPS